MGQRGTYVKKIRITVNKGSNGKRIPVFDTPEALYVWYHDPDLQKEARLDPNLGTMIYLRHGETMEVEWMGCEFITEGNEVLRIDQVRIAKNIKSYALRKNEIIGIHSGWTIEEFIPFKSRNNEDVKCVRLTKKSKHKFNIEELFAAKAGYEDAPQEINPEDLH